MLNQASESEMPPFQACQGKAAGSLSLAGPQLDLLRLLSLLKIKGHLVSRDQSLAHLKWSANSTDLVYAQTSAELPGVKEKKRIPGLPGSLHSGWGGKMVVNGSAKWGLELRSAFRVQQLLTGYLLGTQASQCREKWRRWNVRWALGKMIWVDEEHFR